MGCCKSKGSDDAPLPAIDLAGLDGPSKFEAMLPFKRLRIEALEHKLKAISGESKSIPLDKMKAELGNEAVWVDLKNDDSVLVKILQSEYFKAEDGGVSRDALILYGILLSSGDANTKARVFYDVL